MNLQAYAKINLGLRILDKREDGYHEIETVLHQINCFDEIDLKKRPDGQIAMHVDHPAVPDDATNMCYRAALALQKSTQTREGVEIHLKKGIPVGAGLGGGSSDAAAVLKGLVSLWDIDIGLHELHPISAALGSDAPFFLRGGSAYATGRGEILESLELSVPYWIVVVTPPIHVSTAWAYQNTKIREKTPNGGLRHALSDHIHDERYLPTALANDFEPMVFAAFPDIKQLKQQFIKRGADAASMSGSGSSVFGFFRSGTFAQEFAAEFAPPYSVSLTEPFFKPESDHFLTRT